MHRSIDYSLFFIQNIKISKLGRLLNHRSIDWIIKADDFFFINFGSEQGGITSYKSLIWFNRKNSFIFCMYSLNIYIY